jgi:type I restriction enzyme R subunit
MDPVRKRRLPHWDQPGAAFFVTCCLEGSIPAQGLLDLARSSDADRMEKPIGIDNVEWQRSRWKRAFADRERWLDSRPTVRHLERPELAKAVVSAFAHFHGVRYDSIAWVVMPSHYHWVFRPSTEWVSSLGETNERPPRERIVHSINRFTALECNRILGLRGQFWQHECYDHWIRDDDELERIIHYIHGNPVVAGLVDSPDKFPFSSAYRAS